ncbi:hypothetical protein VNTUMSATTG_61320 (plasmid) [Vibrio nigripulchritudo]|nr:hypothetical protein [Vibrio nigripulchritudo]BCL74195.1 hypothetical protein VNTUMSATTG_61320 [Vibrio nigripulchritudo]
MKDLDLTSPQKKDEKRKAEARRHIESLEEQFAIARYHDWMDYERPIEDS